ncbi:hypothetical protein A4X03_0g7300 [Tilletia caries]|uniref:Uncharacterized protein n=1 Tax=Tilletia caries TaxID=13290 RepID=A0A8T8SQS7_9BASI|nr:hypothetical protein A4X03_0g7300 [Tilletia caries]
MREGGKVFGSGVGLRRMGTRQAAHLLLPQQLAEMGQMTPVVLLLLETEWMRKSGGGGSGGTVLVAQAAGSTLGLVSLARASRRGVSDW